MTRARDELISGWLVDDLDAAGVAALEDLLQSDPVARARFARFCQSEVVLRQAAAMASQRPPSTAIRRGQRVTRRMLPHRAQTPWRWLLAVATAALVAVAVLVAALATQAAPPAGSPLPPSMTSGPLELRSGAGEVRCAGRRLRLGERVPRMAVAEVSGAGVVFRWLDDGSEIAAAAGTSLRVEAGGTLLHLQRGEVDVCISTQAGAPFIISAPHATAAVMGTRFTLRADAQTTRLLVSEGRVRFTAARRDLASEVIAGEQAVADADGFRRGDERVLGFTPTGRDITRVLGPALLRRATMRLADLPADGINLRIGCAPEVMAVRTGMRGVDERLEQVREFHVFGDTDQRATTAWKPRLGTFVIDAQPYVDRAGRVALGPAVVFELTIVP